MKSKSRTSGKTLSPESAKAHDLTAFAPNLQQMIDKIYGKRAS